MIKREYDKVLINVLKTDGEVIGILDNPKALLKWAISGPIISELLTHENDDNDDFQKRGNKKLRHPLLLFTYYYKVQ